MLSFCHYNKSLNLNNLWYLKGVSFGLSSSLLGLLGTLENFIENTFGVYVSMSLGDHGNDDINGQDVWPQKKGRMFLFAPCYIGTTNENS
jgi:hypothetical protein